MENIQYTKKEAKMSDERELDTPESQEIWEVNSNTDKKVPLNCEHTGKCLLVALFPHSRILGQMIVEMFHFQNTVIFLFQAKNYQYKFHSGRHSFTGEEPVVTASEWACPQRLPSVVSLLLTMFRWSFPWYRQELAQFQSSNETTDTQSQLRTRDKDVACNVNGKRSNLVLSVDVSLEMCTRIPFHACERWNVFWQFHLCFCNIPTNDLKRQLRIFSLVVIPWHIIELEARSYIAQWRGALVCENFVTSEKWSQDTVPRICQRAH